MTELQGANEHAATRLRRQLAENDFVLAPGVYDGFSARIALEVGFDCLYMVWQPDLCFSPRFPFVTRVTNYCTLMLTHTYALINRQAPGHVLLGSDSLT